MAPSTRSAGYRCSLPGLAGFTGVPSPGTDPYLSQNVPRDPDAAVRAGRGRERPDGRRQGKDHRDRAEGPRILAARPGRADREAVGPEGEWVVLYFYPKDDTPGCTTEACDFTAGIKGFEKLDATVLGCSGDSPESHRKFIAKYKLKVRLLTDAEHRTMAAYGAWGEKNMYGARAWASFARRQSSPPTARSPITGPA